MAKNVITIENETTVKDAASLMASRRWSCLVVLQRDAAVGIVD
jgi:CBS domain-containing protein